MLVFLALLASSPAMAKKPASREGVQETRPPEIPADFVGALDRSRMFLVEPFDYVRIDPVPNDAMTYGHALLAPWGDFEIRYAILPPDPLYETTFAAVALNVGGDGVTSPVTVFAPDAVQSDFRAQWGAVQNLGAAPRFTKGKWAHCVLVALHRDGLGDAYVFFLYNDKAVADRELPLSMRALTFMDPLAVEAIEGSPE